MPIIYFHGFGKGERKSLSNNTAILDNEFQEGNHYDTFFTKYRTFSVVDYIPIRRAILILLTLINVSIIIWFNVTVWSDQDPWYFLMFPAVSILLIFLHWKWVITAPARKFVTFDRLTGIVHIPHVFSKDYDRILFEDASFVLMDRITYPANESSFLYLVRPGWDVYTKGMVKGRRWLLELMPGGTRDDLQSAWNYVATFMSDKSEQHKRLRRYESKPNTLKHFDPDKLTDDLTWKRDADGTWKKVGRD